MASCEIIHDDEWIWTAKAEGMDKMSVAMMDESKAHESCS